MNDNIKTAAQRALGELFYEDDGQWLSASPSQHNVTKALAPVLAALGMDQCHPPARYELEQAEMLALDHSPLIAQVRKGHNGEKAYAAMWEATMATFDDDDQYDPPIRCVLRTWATGRSRSATPACSPASRCGWGRTSAAPCCTTPSVCAARSGRMTTTAT